MSSRSGHFSDHLPLSPPCHPDVVEARGGHNTTTRRRSFWFSPVCTTVNPNNSKTYSFKEMEEVWTAL